MFAWSYAGRRLDKAIKVIKEYNSKGIACSLSFLPVRKESPKEIREDVNQYKAMLRDIAKDKLDCDVTIKLHQFGIYGGYALAKRHVEQVVREAKKLKNFVWIDMEMTETIDDTIRLYMEMNKKYKNVGICVQAYLKRSENDMIFLLKHNARIRLVKGFYCCNEFGSWAEVTKNYEKLMKYLLKHSKKGCVATHDLGLISKAKKIIKNKRLKQSELQMFARIRDELAEKQVKQGYRMRIYIPFGDGVGFILKGFFTFDLFRMIQRMLKLKKIY